MTQAIDRIRVPHERSQAKGIVESTFIPVGYHISGEIDSTTPVILTRPYDAQFLKLQAWTNLRYTVDGETPTTATGFRLIVGSDVLIPVAVNRIVLIAESNSGTYEAQWVR